MQHVASRTADRSTRSHIRNLARHAAPPPPLGAAPTPPGSAPTPPPSGPPISEPTTPIAPPPDLGTTPPDDGAATQETPPDGRRDGAGILIPSEDMRHLLARFSYGVTESLVDDARGLMAGESGGADLLGNMPDDAAASWFEQQLQPENVPDAFATQLKSWWPHLSWTPQEQWDHDQQGDIQGWEVQDDFQRWTLMRRIYSNRQVLEIMSEFWSNLLHVPAPLSKVFPQRISYDTTIRRHALGRYDDLLVAAVLHPAMLCYLDNAKSTKVAPNENLGRELLELHTVGHEAGIRQADVVGSTNILTGWRVDMGDTWAGYYSNDDHYVGAVRVFGFTAPNDSSDGRALTIRYLRWLARRPETAARVAERLATRFISDSPSKEVVQQLAGVFRRSGTDIRTTLRALVAHPEFRKSLGSKVRTANDDLTNTYRVLGVRVHEPTRITDAAVRILNSAKIMGQVPFGWPAPNGFPDASQAWSSASRVLGSWDIHRRLAMGNLPATGVDFRTVEHWLPEMPCRFGDLVDHLARRILAMPASETHITAASAAVGVDPREIVHRHSTLVDFRFAQLLLALLDTPEHMTR